MYVKNQLDTRVEKWALLKHPFYKAWEAGELPQKALQAYASEYGAFIASMPSGWETLNDSETAEEEREHIVLWQDFASGLDTKIDKAQLPAIKELVASAENLFSQEPTALGALYAFEVQQPETAKSKLEGLKAHYDLPASVEPYFEEHSHNEHEAEKLLGRINELSEDDKKIAFQACEQMSSALWDALTDIYDTHCKM
jgi:pyrroloquinoline-quinone synthase